MNELYLKFRAARVRALAGGHVAEARAVCSMILPWHPRATDKELAEMVVELRDPAPNKAAKR